MPRPAAPALSLLGLALSASTTAFTALKVASDLCLPDDMAMEQFTLNNQLSCSMECTSTITCLGFCYGKSDNNCLLFNQDLTTATANAVRRVGYQMSWAATPPGFQRRGEKSYKLMMKRYTSSNARIECEKWNATVILPENYDELYFIRSLTRHIKFLVAVNDELEEGVWRENYKGVRATFLPWVKGQPSLSRQENCAFFDTMYGYHDYVCNNNYYFVCEVSVA